MRIIAAATLAIAGVLAVPAHAVASCGPPVLSEQIARADVVAFGTVASVRMTFAPASGVITFRPERVLKGSLDRSVDVFLGPTHGGAITSVDYQAASPQRHTLYLRAVGDGTNETDACSGSHEGAPTDEETRALGAGSTVSVTDPLPLAMVALVLLGGIVAALVVLVAGRRPLA